MSRWHPLEPVDESFFDTAPFVYRNPVELQVPPERVWESLTSDRALADWGLGLHSLEWTSSRPFGVGTTRTVVLPLKTVAVHERFFRWDEGVQKSFYGTEINRRIVRRFAEDYLVEKTSDGCRFTWTIALEPTDKTRTLLRVTSPLSRLMYKSVPIRAKAYFRRSGADSSP